MMETCCSRFTAAEGGARLAAAAGEKNILAVEYASFIATRLVHEDAYKIRGRLSYGCKRSVFVCRASRVACVAYELQIMTDLKVVQGLDWAAVDWGPEMEEKEVLVCTSEVLKRILEEQTLTMSQLNVLIVDSCHLVCSDHNLQFIMKLYKQCPTETRPRILALTYPLFSPPTKENSENDRKNNENYTKCSDSTECSEVTNCSDDTKSTDNVKSTDNIKSTDNVKSNDNIKSTDSVKSTDNIKSTDNVKSTDNIKSTDNVKSSDNIKSTDNVKSSDNIKSTDNIKNSENIKISEDDVEINEDNVATSEDSTEISDNDAKTVENSVKKDQCKEIGVNENLDDFEMYEKLEWKIEELEKELCCEMDLAEDIDGGKRLSGTITKPKELIIEYCGRGTAETLPEAYVELDSFMRDTVNDAVEFIAEHRYDPTEIYGEEMYEEFKNIPDPAIEPKFIFKQFLYVLDQLGPYAADKAAFSLLAKLEKLKIKVPYERHFLLLCLCTSVFVKIRCYADTVFTKYDSDWERIKTFCTPKVLRFAEILQKFQPPELLKTTSENTAKMLSELEKCDFVSLGNKIEDKVNTYEANLKELDDFSTDNKNSAITDRSGLENSDRVAHTRNIETESDTPSNKSDSTSNRPDSTTNRPDSTTNKPDSASNQCDSATNSSDTTSNKFDSTTNIPDSASNKCDSTSNRTDCASNKYDSTTTNRPDSASNKCDSVTNKPDSASNKCGSATNKPDNTSNRPDSASNALDSGQKPFGFTRRSGGRVRGRGRSQRGNTARVQQTQQNPDALCGIVFMKEALMAKIMFMLIVDMSRAHRALSYICAQYCAVEAPADPATEAKECQRQGKKQEEVLKKFRMHECNLLLATSALEEGIDLPRCNLVLRWDVPQSYRSYGLCRGRARAGRAACAVLCLGHDESAAELLHNLATYREIDQIISRKCGCGIQDEPPQPEEDHADAFNLIVKAYTPQEVTAKEIKVKTPQEILANSIKDNAQEDTAKNIKSNDPNVVKTRDNQNEVSKDNVNNDCRQISNDKNNKDSNIKNSQATDANNEAIDNIQYHRQLDGIDYKNSETNSLKEDTNEKDTLMKAIENIQRTDLEKRFDNLKISDTDNLEDKSGTQTNSISENIKDNLRTDNLYCNKCNNMKTSVNVECPCVIPTISDRNKVRFDSKFEKDSKKVDCEIASVDLNSAIALINRYCGKLPSDTFTRLAPQWWTEEVQLPSGKAYICTLRLPLNCPVKYNIVGHPMPTRVLARRMAALQACRILHKSGELDNQLMPIGKENFKAAELETPNPLLGDTVDGDARPGTTKRRQYYFKRTAWAFTDCQPVVDTSDSEIDPAADAKPAQPKTEPAKKGTKRNMLYAIVSKLWCALPERYNTRGRRLHAPQNATQAIGILMARNESDDLQIPAFPVYTRSGEVRVSVEYVPDADVRMSPRRGRLVRRFMRFVFAEVLRVRRKGMRLQSDVSSHNNYYVVPTIKTVKDGSAKIDIDWGFLELIYQHTEQKKLSLEKPLLWQQDEEEDEVPVEKVEKEKDKQGKKVSNPLLKDGETFVFDSEKYREAVVTPWYRNQDQPQFFLVAEICWNLSPDSAFPSATHTSFRNYYSNKYGVVLTQPNQPLLDVDHTSARLNLLTPRYVNRKGVALPVSSERTRRAKRDRLDQKQILVPELCRVHPFAAPLWFATVALPCVLYRINALLIADEIRRAVAIDVGLGIPKIDEKTCPGFQWPPLDFGWSLAEVLSADSEKNDKKKDEEEKKEDKDIEIKDTEEVEESQKSTEEPKEKTINDILAEKEDAESGFEIGTWSNDMASSIPDSLDYDEYMEPLPSNLTFCTSASGGTNWCDPIEKPKSQFNPSRTFSMAESDCSYMSSDFDTDDSELNSDSDDDTENGGFWSKNSMGVRIEYKTAHEAEAVDVEKKTKTRPQPQNDPEDDAKDRAAYKKFIADGTAPQEYIDKFRSSVTQHKQDLITNGNLITKDKTITDILPETREHKPQSLTHPRSKIIDELFPYGQEGLSIDKDGQINLESIEKNKRVLLQKLKEAMSDEEIKKLQCFSMADVDIDSPNYVNEKVVNVGFDKVDSYVEKVTKWDDTREFKPYYQDGRSLGKEFDFDYQPDLEGHPGPSPSVILQALTMSNANDGINLERLETIGDSFLKFAITAYLYCAHPAVHEGKLSHMRSKQVSNLNLYRLGRSKRLGARMIASKFEPHDNWLPPCHRPPHTHAPPNTKTENLESNTDAPVDSSGCFIPYNLITQHSIPDKSIADCVEALIGAYLLECGPRGALLFMSWLGIRVLPRHLVVLPEDHPYVKAAKAGENGEHKPDPPASPKHTNCSDSDYDSDCSSDDSSPWTHPDLEPERLWGWAGRSPGSLRPYALPNGQWVQPVFGELKAPPSPLLRYIEDPEGELEQMLSGYDALERTLQYRFKDRSLLLQALTHASHQKNRLTDCYQRLEFLGDAILDYLITRHLYEDPRRHSPGALTDLRSALVNNTIFATLAARHGFHKYFRHMSPGLNEVLTKYVKIQEENGHSISEEHYLIQEDEMEQAEDVEVPKALGDLFESVAGAIFLDSGMSLGAVWQSYVTLMGAELEAFSAAAPKSPVRELLEAEPDTAKFGKPERLADGRRVRVCVEVFGRGAFKGVGRNYRIAKGTAARCALRHLRAHPAR